MTSIDSILFVGLRSKQARLNTIAPRILTERGDVHVAEALPALGEEYRTLGQRITYLARLLGAGAYQCTLSDATPIAAPAALHKLPEWAVRRLAEKGWVTP